MLCEKEGYLGDWVAYWGLLMINGLGFQDSIVMFSMKWGLLRENAEGFKNSAE